MKAQMKFQTPNHTQLKTIVEEFGMHMSDQTIQEFLDAMQDLIQEYAVVDSMSDYLPSIDYARSQVFFPKDIENPYNAWYVTTEICGASDGPLLGKRVALKDNICVAGVPMMNGASTLQGYIPDIDATVVTRLLDAGATIAGKAHCEYFCVSGGSHTNALGPVHNPHRKGYSAGGSSSGSAALVGGGIVDMAIGGDQGGSIRIPAAYSGCYGLKPTFGLVPYTGVMPIDTSIDHIGPMTQTVLDNAKMLNAIAGEDGLDPRQCNLKIDNYVDQIDRGINHLRIGILKEGFGWHASESDVDSKVYKAASLFANLGASITEVSIPLHRKGNALWTAIGLEGLTNQMMHGNAMGTGWGGLHISSLVKYHANWRSQVDELDDTVKMSMMVGQYYRKHHHGYYYSKAQNIVRKLRIEYDKAFENFDLLLMPTVPMKATPLPPPDAPLKLKCQRSNEMGANACVANLTGHPAMSLPCGMSKGLPVGLMLVAAKWRESTIYNAAYALEQAEDWRTL